MNRPTTRFLLIAFLACAGFLNRLNAQVAITEVSSKSALDNDDYFELSNLGLGMLDVTGWLYDDESADIMEAVPLNGISMVNPSESVIFIQLDVTDSMDPAYDPATEVMSFRDAWGGLPGVQVGWHAGAGLGKGDAINLFEPSGMVAITLLYGMTTPEETHAGDWAANNTDGSDTFENEAAVWVPGTFPQEFVLAEAGVLGSFSNTSGEFGSPGILVPEPNCHVLAFFGMLGLLLCRRCR